MPFAGVQGEENTQEDVDQVCKDHFVSSPFYQLKVNQNVSDWNAAEQQIALLKDQIGKAEALKNGASESKMKEIKAKQEFCDALFSGVITIDGMVVNYREEKFGIVNDHVLSKRGDEFRYASVPLYSGYLEFQKLPEDMKNDIRKLVDDRLNAGGAELLAAGQKVSRELTKEKVNGSAQSAKMQWPSESDTIIRFLMDVMTLFDTYCKQNGISNN